MVPRVTRIVLGPCRPGDADNVFARRWAVIIRVLDISLRRRPIDQRQLPGRRHLRHGRPLVRPERRLAAGRRQALALHIYRIVLRVGQLTDRCFSIFRIGLY